MYCYSKTAPIKIQAFVFGELLLQNEEERPIFCNGSFEKKNTFKIGRADSSTQHISNKLNQGKELQN